MKQSEAFIDFLHWIIGARIISLAYVVKKSVNITRSLPALALNSSHLEEHSFLEEQIVEFTSNTHPLFENYLATVYYCLEEATHCMSYVLSIKPYQRRKNGRNTQLAIVSQYADKDKQDREINKKDNFYNPPSRRARVISCQEYLFCSFVLLIYLWNSARSIQTFSF